MANCSCCGIPIPDGNVLCHVCAGGQQPGQQPQGQQPQGYQPQGQQPQGYQPQGYQPQGYQPQGYQPQGYQPQGYQPQGYQPQGYQPQGYQPQGYQPQGYQPQGYQPQGYQPQGYQPQGYQPQGYQPQGYQPQGYQSQSYQPQGGGSAPRPSVQEVAAGLAGQTVKKGLSGGAKAILIMLITALVTGALVAVFMFTDLGKIFKSDEQLIRERIQAYEDACNDGDYEAMLDCMNSSTRAMTEAATGLMGGILSEGIGFDIDISSMMGLAGAAGDFFEFEIIDITVNGEEAVVELRMTATMYGQEQVEEAELPMVKEDGDWYIGMDNPLAGMGLG